MSSKKKSTYEKIVESIPIAKKVHIVKPEKVDGVIIPATVIEALLVSVANTHHAAVIDVCNQIKAIAEKQG